MRSLLFLLISVAGAALAAPPAHVEMTFEVTRNGSPVAEISDTLDYGAGKYEIVESWQGRGFYRLLGNAKRTSRGSVGAEGLRPLQYTDERTGRDTERVLFDWRARTVTYQYKDPPTTIPLPPNPRDRLQFLFQFAFKPPASQRVVLDVMDGRGISDQIYQVEGHERFKTPAGDFDALKLVRRKENNERAEIWLAANRDYLPVRIIIVTKDGSRLDQFVTRIASP